MPLDFVRRASYLLYMFADTCGSSAAWQNILDTTLCCLLLNMSTIDMGLWLTPCFPSLLPSFDCCSAALTGDRGNSKVVCQGEDAECQLLLFC